MPKEQDIVELENRANDKEYVLSCVAKRGALLEFASEDLRNDKEVAWAAIKNNPEALEFVSDGLKGDRDVVFESVSKVRLDVLLCEKKFTTG